MNIDSDRINFLFSGSGSLIGPNVAFLPQDSHFTGPHTNTGGMEKRSRKLNGAPVVMTPKTCCRLQAGPESSTSRGTFQSDLQSTVSRIWVSVAFQRIRDSGWKSVSLLVFFTAVHEPWIKHTRLRLLSTEQQLFFKNHYFLLFVERACMCDCWICNTLQVSFALKMTVKKAFSFSFRSARCDILLLISENWWKLLLIRDWGIFGHTWRFVLIDDWDLEKFSGQLFKVHNNNNVCVLVLTNQWS